MTNEAKANDAETPNDKQTRRSSHCYMAGDVVKVWSLQSFHGGGFINGAEGVVKQDQIGSSVIVAVERNMDGRMKIDPSYEVYEQQLELVHRPRQVPDGLADLIYQLKSM